MFGVIVYRVAVFAALTAASDENIGSISLTVTATAAVINLVIILILSYVSTEPPYNKTKIVFIQDNSISSKLFFLEVQ